MLDTEALKKQGLEQMANTVNFNVITIEPVKIRYLCYRRGFRNVIWKKEEYPTINKLDPLSLPVYIPHQHTLPQVVWADVKNLTR